MASFGAKVNRPRHHILVRAVELRGSVVTLGEALPVANEPGPHHSLRNEVCRWVFACPEKGTGAYHPHFTSSLGRGMLRLIKADLSSTGKPHFRNGTPSRLLNVRALTALLGE